MKISQNEFTTLLALLEWANGQKDLLKKLEKTPTVQATLKPPPKPAAKGKKAKPTAKPKNPLTATLFSAKVKKALLAAFEEAKQEAKFDKGMKIKQWIAYGELAGTEADTKEVLAFAGNLLDEACVADIVGQPLFLGSDGRYYTVHVAAIIDEADEDFVDERVAIMLADTAADMDAEDDDDDQTADPVIASPAAGAADASFPVEGYEDAPTGKPLTEVLDTTTTVVPDFGLQSFVVEGTETFRGPGGGMSPEAVTGMLDRIETDAVAGADALEAAELANAQAVYGKAVSEQAATVAAVVLGRPVEPGELKSAIANYGYLSAEAARAKVAELEEKLKAETGLLDGDVLARDLDRAKIALAVRTWMDNPEATDARTDGAAEPGVGEATAGE